MYVIVKKDGTNAPVTEREEKMKLSEHIAKKFHPHGVNSAKILSEEIEEWIVEWYRSEFSEIGSDKGKKRAPPSWLANWRKE